MPLRLYDYAASCNCYKARLLLAQLGVEYERVPGYMEDVEPSGANAAPGAGRSIYD